MTKDSRLTLRSSRTPEPDDVTTGVNRDTDVDKMFALSPQAADEVTTFLFTQYLTVFTYSIVTSSRVLYKRHESVDTARQLCYL